MAKLNIIVGTHGHFGEELVKSAELITGKMEGVRTLSLLPEMSFEDFNVLTVLSKKYNYDIVSGVNLPMLIDLYVKTLSMEDSEIDTDKLAEECIDTLKESGVHTNKQV